MLVTATGELKLAKLCSGSTRLLAKLCSGLTRLLAKLRSGLTSLLAKLCSWSSRLYQSPPCLSRICAIGAEISVLVFYERLVGNDFVAVAAPEAVLVIFVCLYFHVLRSRRNWLSAGIEGTPLRIFVCVAIRAEGLVRVDEEFSFPKCGSAAIAEKTLFVISMLLKTNSTVRQWLIALLALLGNVFVVALVAVELFLMVNEALRTGDAIPTSGTFETTRVIFRPFVFRQICSPDNCLPALLAVPNCHL